jgi:hypothetical protein
MDDFKAFRRDRPRVGDLVLVRDYSEAHGESGTVYAVQGDMIVVELHGEDEGTLWPCLYAELHIMKRANPAPKTRK